MNFKKNKKAELSFFFFNGIATEWKSFNLKLK